MQDFVKQLMEAARAAGIEACEAYLSSRDSFRVMTTEGEVVEYESNCTRGLGFRGLYRGRMGYASTEAFDGEAVGQLVRGVQESAELSEDDDETPLYEGGRPVPEMDLRSPTLSQVTPQEKIDRVLAMEKLVKESDPHRQDGAERHQHRQLYGAHRQLPRHGPELHLGRLRPLRPGHRQGRRLRILQRIRHVRARV